MNVIFRRPKLGRTSCREIAKYMDETIVRCHGKKRPVPYGGNYLFRWGCTANVPPGYEVVNSAKAIHLVNDKHTFRKMLDEEELCTPTWLTMHAEIPDAYYPVIVRPRNHSRGKDLYYCKDRGEMIAAAEKCGFKYYINQYVDKVAEYRVFVVSGRVVCVAEKTPANPDDIAWNVAQGGRFDVLNWDDWPLQAVRKSIEAFNMSGLNFGGVDVMTDVGGTSHVIEINSAPSLTSPYRQQCMAKGFNYIIEHGKRTIPLTKEKGGYRKFIHPAVCDRAILVE
jgi:glutathione synthase/RimK-type ligase-like ATP-grasp enzyme